ncbi:MAG: YjeF-related protein [Bacteroidetes bacterium]|nr:YjeF-related protein [Bacteroidota bacterium]
MQIKINQNLKSLIKRRDPASHKGDFGHALLIAGSPGFMGACMIAAKACLRSGVGLLTLNVPIEERFALQASVPEAMLTNREEPENNFEKFSAIGIGPGIGTGIESRKLLETLLKKHSVSLVLDADALNLISLHNKLWDKIPKQSIITPHPKEFDHLFGSHKNNNDRIKTAVIKARELNIVIVLKDHNTLVTYKGESFFNTTGNAGLAKGGSGDALTGIITAFLAQGYLPFISAKLAVYLHGLAADITLKEQSEESMLITDVIDNLGKAFKLLHK